MPTSYGIENISYLFPYEPYTPPEEPPPPEPTYETIIPRTARVTQAAAQTAGAPFTALRPIDQAVGDLVVAWFGYSDSPARITKPGAPWVEVPSSQIVPVSGKTAVAFYQFDPASDPVISMLNAGRLTAVLQAYGNVDPDNPLDIAAAVTATAAATPLVIGSASPVTPGARVISAAIIDASTGSWTIPVEQTLVGAQTSGVGRGLAVSDEVFPEPGATGTRTFAFSVGSVAMAGATMALRPALVDDEEPPPEPPPIESIFTTQSPDTTNLTDGSYTLGTVFKSDVDGQVVGVRVYVGNLPSNGPIGALYSWTDDENGVLLASEAFGTLTPNSWNEVLFDTPIDIIAGQHYVTCWTTNNYNVTAHFFDTGDGASDVVSGHLTATHKVVGRGNGKFHVGTTLTYPDQEFNATCYFVDTLFQPPTEG